MEGRPCPGPLRKAAPASSPHDLATLCRPAASDARVPAPPWHSLTGRSPTAYVGAPIVDFLLSLQSERVTAVYPEAPLATTPETPVAIVLQLLRAQKTGAVLVCEGDKMVGIFTERDALRLMAEASSGAPTAMTRPVSDFMSPHVVSIGVTGTVGEAIGRMSAGAYRHLPMVDSKGRPKGTISTPGIVRYLVEHFPDTIYTLPPVTGRPPAEREGA